MNLLSEIREATLAALDTLIDLEGLPLQAVKAEIPAKPEHGDIAVNAAMVLAKRAGLRPRDLAADLAGALQDNPLVAEAWIAGPGFVNIRIAWSAWARLLDAVRSQPGSFGSVGAPGGAINVEYVSANPTGPLTIGHARGAVVGDAIANLLADGGHRVTREYYVNDAGAQMHTLADSLRLRLRELEGEAIGPFPENHYPGIYVINLAQQAREAGYDSDTPQDELVRLATAMMMEHIQLDLWALGIDHDSFVHETAISASGQLDDALDALRRLGLAYTGTLPPPRDADPETWVAEEQLLFKSTAYGDDVDRSLIKADGSPTYFAGDVAYHRDKVARGFDGLVAVMGADHSGYVTRLKAVVSALSEGRVDLDMPLVGLVNLLRDGAPVKMSKRTGTFVSLAEVIAEVGAEAVRFTMLTRKPETPLDFDLEAVKRAEKDNPVYYVQYAHARCCSLARRARSLGVHARRGEIDPDRLAATASPADMALLRTVMRFPSLLAEARAAREPHRVAGYLQELAAAFHQHWTAGQDDPSARVLVEDDPEATRLRLALVHAVRITLARGLSLLGVTPVERMARTDAAELPAA